MVFFNYATMQMAAKIVYYGPGLCGKTTNLHHIYAKTSPQSRGEMVSLETETDRTLFFDLLPIDVGVIGGFKTRLQLYTIPGQVFYNTTRKLVLKGVDGIVFVADSQKAMLDANLESFKNLRENLAEIGLSIDEIPLVLQLNKRDLPNIAPADDDRRRHRSRAQVRVRRSGGVARRRRLRDAEGHLETDAADAAPAHDRRGAGKGDAAPSRPRRLDSAFAKIRRQFAPCRPRPRLPRRSRRTTRRRNRSLSKSIAAEAFESHPSSESPHPPPPEPRAAAS